MREADSVSSSLSASEPGSESGAPLIPARIPDHDLLHRVGRGAYGEVWIARSVTGALRAVKVVRRASFDNDRPFEREFEGIRRFEPISRHHESQVDILHVGRGDDYFYYVMELADDQATGGQINPENYHPRTLKSDLLFRDRLPFEECLSVGIALTTALEHLHENGLVHRDVKPSNIIFVNGVAKLADIGLVTGVDTTRSYVGTEGFAAPEGPGTPQADIYSLGKVLYEISTGKDRQEFPELPTNLRELPDREGLAELNAVIARACRHDPRDRYQHAAAMHDDLELLSAGKSIRRIQFLERRLMRLRKLSIGVGLVFVVATIAYFFQRAQTARVKQLASANLQLARKAEEKTEEARRNLYAADISQIHQALAKDNMRQARDLLQKQIPKPGESDLRGFEWRYLWQKCRPEELANLGGPQELGTTAIFSPDGKMLATGSNDKTIKLWDLASRTVRASLTVHTNEITSLDFCPKGNWLASGSRGTVAIWDARTYRHRSTLPDATTFGRFSPDGKLLITYSTNGLIAWNAHTWTIASTYESTNILTHVLHGGLTMGFDYSANSDRLFILKDDGVQTLTVPDFKEERFFAEPMPWIRFVATSPMGDVLATSAAPDGSIKIWNIETGEQSVKLDAHSDSVFDAAFSPDGRTLATCSADQTIKLWDVTNGSLLRVFRGHADEVWGVVFSPDGKMLASAGHDANKLWDLTTPKIGERDLPIVLPLGFGADGNLWGFRTNGPMKIVDPITLEEIATAFNFHPGGTNGVSVYFGNLFSDGRTAAFGIDEENKFVVWDTQENRLLCTLDAFTYLVSYAPHKRLFATTGREEHVTLSELPIGKQKYVLTNAWLPYGFSRDESMLATISKGGTNLTIFDVQVDPPRELRTIHSGAWLSDVRFSPDNRLIAAADNSVIKIWQLPSGRLANTLVGHKRRGISLSFSPDGKTLASLCDDRSLRLWHVPTGRELMKFEVPLGDISFMVLGFSPDGRSLLYRLNNKSSVVYAPSVDEIAITEGKEVQDDSNGDPFAWWWRAKALDKHNRIDEAVTAFTRVIDLTANAEELAFLRTSALLRRARVWSKLKRRSEEVADVHSAFGFASRDPRTPRECLDLSPVLNGPLQWINAAAEPGALAFRDPFLVGLSPGLQTVRGVPNMAFDIRGVCWLGTSQQVEVRQKGLRLHFLQGTGAWEDEGVPVASYIVRYVDGRQQQIPVIYGQHTRDWVERSDRKSASSASIAWTGTHPGWGTIRFFDYAWDNPRPEIEITSIDLVKIESKCFPFVAAITLQ